MTVERPEVLPPVLFMNIKRRNANKLRMQATSSQNVSQTMGHSNFSRLAFFFIVFGLMTCAVGYGQDTKASKDSVSEPSNIVKYTDFIATRFAVNNNFNSFSVIDDANGMNFDISPNQRLRSIFTIQFRFVDIDIGFTLIS